MGFLDTLTAPRSSSLAGDFISALVPSLAQGALGYYGNRLSSETTSAEAQKNRDFQLQLQQMSEAQAQKLQQERLEQEMAAAEMMAAVQQQANLQRAYEAAMNAEAQGGQLGQNALNSFTGNVLRSYGR